MNEETIRRMGRLLLLTLKPKCGAKEPVAYCKYCQYNHICIDWFELKKELEATEEKDD